MVQAGEDGFAAFLDAVASVLDGEVARTEAIAAKVGLSRSHLSRLVSAVAHEAPSALCRRVLLERAAYRLVTSGDAILDIALEAGYSSHEAFTRAFSSAYGVAPGLWRRAPTRLQIDAPNGVHFHPPGSLVLPARGKVLGMDLMVRMLEHNVWLIEEMLRRCERLPGEALDRPIELSVAGVDPDPSLRSLLARLVGQMEMWSAAIAGHAYSWPDATPSVMELRRRLALVGPEFVAQVREICDDGRLDEAVLCPGDEVEVYTYGGVVAHVLTYAAHRRILVAGALEDEGITDLDEDPVRWISAAG
ncbi:MAG: helix-turn-helix domain-containing protein [Actinomycetes bacterium]